MSLLCHTAGWDAVAPTTSRQTVDISTPRPRSDGTGCFSSKDIAVKQRTAHSRQTSHFGSCAAGDSWVCHVPYLVGNVTLSKTHTVGILLSSRKAQADCRARRDGRARMGHGIVFLCHAATYGQDLTASECRPTAPVHGVYRFTVAAAGAGGCVVPALACPFDGVAAAAAARVRACVCGDTGGAAAAAGGRDG